MLLRNLFEARVPDADAAFCFGRFNPAHQGHIEVWKTVQAAGKKWYVGTNPSTQGPNDPLTFDQKTAWMQAIYPPIHGHILPQQSVVTLASKLYEILGEGSTIAYVTDSNDWAWAGKLLNDYNGKEGPHGYYKFAAIRHVESPRVSSATALRTAARAGDEAAFYAASGTNPELTVSGKTYFETVVDAVGANPEKPKKVVKKKVAEPVETIEKHGSGYRLVSKHGHKNLGTYPTKAGAEKRERQVQYFKHAGEGVAEDDSKAMASTASRLSNKDDGKVAKLRAAGDKRREEELKGRNIAKRNESVDLKTSLQELSNDMLGKYKKAAGADASKADKAGDFKRGDKRFSGINKATMKQFDNDAKKSKTDEACWKDYKQIGMKKKGGKTVPNCVPKK